MAPEIRTPAYAFAPTDRNRSATRVLDVAVIGGGLHGLSAALHLALASPLLTREMFYTAVTRAERTVRVVGSEEVVRAAVARRVVRASGLRQRLIP